MFSFGDNSIKAYQAKCKRRKAKKLYWMNKGCSEWKAESLLQRYGY